MFKRCFFLQKQIIFHLCSLAYSTCEEQHKKGEEGNSKEPPIASPRFQKLRDNKSLCNCQATANPKACHCPVVLGCVCMYAQENFVMSYPPAPGFFLSPLAVTDYLHPLPCEVSEELTYK